jgi:hypothetical protein
MCEMTARFRALAVFSEMSFTKQIEGEMPA